jgi:hypothetical protein
MITSNKETPKANLFAAPEALLRHIDALLRDHPRRMGIALELFEQQHHHASQAAYEVWVRQRMNAVFDEQLAKTAPTPRKRGVR